MSHNTFIPVGLTLSGESLTGHTGMSSITKNKIEKLTRKIKKKQDKLNVLLTNERLRHFDIKCGAVISFRYNERIKYGLVIPREKASMLTCQELSESGVTLNTIVTVCNVNLDKLPDHVELVSKTSVFE